MTLPGLTQKALPIVPLVVVPPYYTDLVTGTLGPFALDADPVDALIQALIDAEAAYEADVTAETITDSLPDGSVFAGTIAALTALGLEVDLDQDFQIISDALAGLGVGLVVLDLLNQLWPTITDALETIYNDALNEAAVIAYNIAESFSVIFSQPYPEPNPFGPQ